MTNTLEKASNWYNPFYIEGRQVKNIYLYNESGIICETGRGWFGDNNDMDSLFIGETIRKAKFNPETKCNFWIPVAAKCCNVYLYVDGKDITCERLPDSESDMLDHTVIYHYRHYSVTVHGVKKQIETFDHTTTTDFGRKVDKLTETFKEMGLNIDHYNTIKLLKSFNVSKKRKEA